VVTDDGAIWLCIVALVDRLPTSGHAFLQEPLAPTRDTDLVTDLGLIGDDAFEFMERYAAVLEVKQGDYDASDYFEPEGLWLLPGLRKRKPKKRITLGMLESAAREGEWNSAQLAATCASAQPNRA
jgi:hypothetical protein